MSRIKLAFRVLAALACMGTMARARDLEQIATDLAQRPGDAASMVQIELV